MPNKPSTPLKPARTSLFNFATLRGPQLIKDRDKKAFYIEHPDSDRSLFLTKLTGSDSLKEIRLILENNIIDFEPWVRKKQIFNFTRGMFEFSTWLMENQDSVTFEGAENAIGEIEEDIKEEERDLGRKILDSGKIQAIRIEDRLVIWDNLLYSVLTPGNDYVRQACTQILIADNFFRKIRNSRFKKQSQKLIVLPKITEIRSAEQKLELYIRRIAKSKVIIPKFWSTERKERVVDFSQQQSSPATERSLEEKFDELNENELNSWKGDMYQLDLDAFQENLIAGRKNRVSSRKLKNKKIGLLLKRNLKNEVELDDQVAAILSEKSSTQKFNFLDPKYTKGKLDPNFELFLDQHDLRQKSTQGIAQYMFQLQQQSQSSKQIARKRSKGQTFSYHNITVDHFPEDAGSFAFGFNFPISNQDDGKVYLLLRKEIADQEMSNFDFTLSFVNQNKTYRGKFEKDVKVLSSDATHIFLRLFQNRTIKKDEIGAYSFHGQFTLKHLVLSPDGNPKGDVMQMNNYSIHFSSHSGKIITSGQYINNELIGNESSVYGVNKVGIIDFRRVEQEVCCYVPGEISHIENVMAREYKERSTRNFTGSESRIEETSEVQVDNLSDTSTTNRNEMQAEISSVINQENSRNTGFNVGTSISTGPTSPVDVTFDMGFDMQFANSNSRSTTNGTSVTKAKEITEKTLQKVVRKIASKRTSIIRKEFEEKVRHGLDNRTGENNLSGVYRWIDKVYTNRLVNYGKRLTYEFMIPEPARLHKSVIAQKVIEATSNGELPPNVEVVVKSPSELALSISSKADISNKSVLAAYQVYSQFDPSISEIVPFNDLPSKTETISVPYPLTGPFKWTDEWDREDHTALLTVPAGYKCSQIEVDGDFLGKRGIGQGRRRFEIISEQGQRHSQSIPIFMVPVPFSPVAVAQAKEYDILTAQGDNPVFNYSSAIVGLDPTDASTTDLNAGQITMAVKGLGVQTFNVEYHMSLEPVASESDWQEEAFQDVQDMYQKALAAYNLLQSSTSEENYSDPVASAKENSEEEVPTNPAFNREIEKRELKRIAIEMLLAPFDRDISPSKDPNNALIREHICNNSDSDFKVPHVRQTKYLEKYASQVKFFEQAFDWQLISYIFYPYYWTDQCRWQDLLLTKDGDQLFQAFLQSGMARLLVPVRPGFEEAVKFYMNSGEIWHGKGLVVDSDNDLYISIAEELQTTDGIVEESWETTVPTTLTAIQSSTVSLNASGLPCCDKEPTMFYDFNEGDKLGPLLNQSDSDSTGA